MLRRLRILERHRVAADKATLELAGHASAVSQLLERARQAVPFDSHRCHAVCERARDRDALPQRMAHLPRLLLKPPTSGRQVGRRQIFQQEKALHLQCRQLLAEAVVQIMPDALLLPVADFQELRLQPPALRDVTQDELDGRLAVLREHRRGERDPADASVREHQFLVDQRRGVSGPLQTVDLLLDDFVAALAEEVEGRPAQHLRRGFRAEQSHALRVDEFDAGALEDENGVGRNLHERLVATRLFAQLLLRPLALGDVAHEAREDAPVLHPHFTHGQLQREGAPILSPP